MAALVLGFRRSLAVGARAFLTVAPKAAVSGISNSFLHTKQWSGKQTSSLLVSKQVSSRPLTPPCHFLLNYVQFCFSHIVSRSYSVSLTSRWSTLSISRRSFSIKHSLCTLEEEVKAAGLATILYRVEYFYGPNAVMTFFDSYLSHDFSWLQVQLLSLCYSSKQGISREQIQERVLKVIREFDKVTADKVHVL